MQIITDSACDLPKSLIVANNIRVIPLLVVLDGKELVDGRDITPEQVYEAIQAGKVPGTNQTPAHIFRETFMEFINKGIPCLYLSFSSRMSGTFQAGALVARELNEQCGAPLITVVDTKSGSLGQGLLVLAAARMAHAGAGVEEITKEIERRAPRMEHLFTVDDLNYLHRGGRVSGATAFIGSILKIKPLLHVKEGIIVPFQKVRGKNTAIKRLVEIMEDNFTPRDQTIGISHANDPLAADLLRTLVEKAFNVKDIIVNIVGSVLGCHIGLGGVAVFFLNEAQS